MSKIHALTATLFVAVALAGCADAGAPDTAHETSSLLTDEQLEACLSQPNPWIGSPVQACWEMYLEEMCYCPFGEPEYTVECERTARDGLRRCYRLAPH